MHAFSKKQVPNYSKRVSDTTYKEKPSIAPPSEAAGLPVRVIDTPVKWVPPQPSPNAAPSQAPPPEPRQNPFASLIRSSAPAPLRTPLLRSPTIPLGNPIGGSSYSPSLETFTSMGEPYFKLASNTSSDASNWSLFPAIDSVQMNTRSLINVGGITGFLCQMNTVQANHSVITPNLLTDTMTVNSGIINMVDASGTHMLEAIDGNLFYDTELLARAGDIQNIAEWSLYPALGPVDFNSKDLQNVATINGTAYPPTASNWSTFPATQAVDISSQKLQFVNELDLNTGGNSVILTAGTDNVLLINGSPIPAPTAPGVTSLNGITGAITLSGSDTAQVGVVDHTFTVTATGLGVETDTYPTEPTAWGRANQAYTTGYNAGLSATAAGLAAGGAATAAEAAQTTANAAAGVAATALADATTALLQSGVTSVNSGTYAVTIAAGSGIGVATTYSSGVQNPTITISNTGGSGSGSVGPAGSVQYSGGSGTFLGSTNFSWDNTTNTLSAGPSPPQ